MQTFRALLWLEDEWFVVQCLDVDVSSQGGSESEALENIGEALVLHFENPHSVPPSVSVSVETIAAPASAQEVEVSVEI